jgi:hypothetical protein
MWQMKLRVASFELGPMVDQLAKIAGQQHIATVDYARRAANHENGTLLSRSSQPPRTSGWRTRLWTGIGNVIAAAVRVEMSIGRPMSQERTEPPLRR